ncbi:hypothetical protein Ahia01_000380000, partial [Argonauta hians]
FIPRKKQEDKKRTFQTKFGFTGKPEVLGNKKFLSCLQAKFLQRVEIPTYVNLRHSTCVTSQLCDSLRSEFSTTSAAERTPPISAVIVIEPAKAFFLSKSNLNG